MPTTDDYLKSIDEKRSSGQTAKIDFSKLPPDVDSGKIAGALSKGLPDEYGKAITGWASTKDGPHSVNYGIIHIKESVPEKVWDTVKGPVTSAFKAVTTPIPGLKQFGEAADQTGQKIADKISPSQKDIVDTAGKEDKVPYGKIAENVAAHTGAEFITKLSPRTPWTLAFGHRCQDRLRGGFLGH